MGHQEALACVILSNQHQSEGCAAADNTLQAELKQLLEKHTWLNTTLNFWSSFSMCHKLMGSLERGVLQDITYV